MKISIGKMYASLQSLNTSSAVGPDKGHPRVLIVCASQLAAPLCIFNKSFVTDSLPKVWLESVVVPLFSSKSRYDHSNYRPVSLTPVCCKTMERVSGSELVMYLESKGLLSDRQFGFRKHRSTEDLMLVHSEVAAMVDDCLVVDMVMLDFSKAFDILSHTILLKKLREIGVSASLLS